MAGLAALIMNLYMCKDGNVIIFLKKWQTFDAKVDEA